MGGWLAVPGLTRLHTIMGNVTFKWESRREGWMIGDLWAAAGAFEPGGRRREHDDERQHVCSGGAQKERDMGRRKAHVPRGRVHSGRETGRENGAPLPSWT